jgi:hypothetical protein
MELGASQQAMANFRQRQLSAGTPAEFPNNRRVARYCWLLSAALEGHVIEYRL